MELVLVSKDQLLEYPVIHVLESKWLVNSNVNGSDDLGEKISGYLPKAFHRQQCEVSSNKIPIAYFRRKNLQGSVWWGITKRPSGYFTYPTVRYLVHRVELKSLVTLTKYSTHYPGKGDLWVKCPDTRVWYLS